jgi:hypothetical protein
MIETHVYMKNLVFWWLFRVTVRVTLRLAFYRQSARLGDKPLEFTTSNLIFQLNTCGYNPYVTPSLTRGWFCRLWLLLALVSAVILRSESRGAHDHILLSQIRDSLNLDGQVPVLTSPRKIFSVCRTQIFQKERIEYLTRDFYFLHIVV